MSSSDNPTGPPASDSLLNGDHVNLRVTYLHAGNPRPPHNLGAVSVETTIGILKDRLQSELLETPAPQEQRLIYQGRPLLQDGMTLKEALRLEGPAGPLPYTLHIIIQPRQAASHFRPEQGANVSVPTAAAGPLPQMPQMAHPLTAQDAHHQAARVQAIAQAHLNMLQQQLAHITQQNGLQTQNGQAFSTTFINGQPVQPLGAPIPPHIQAAQASTGLPVQPQPPNAASARQTNTTPQQTRVLIQSQNQVPQAGPINGLLNAALPVAQAPLPRPLSVPPLLRPGEQHAFGVYPPHPPMTVPPFAGLPVPPSRGLSSHPPQPANPTVWLASSINGPEAILFAPGHGFFSSNTTSRSDQVRQVQEVYNARTAASTLRTATESASEAQPAAAREDAHGQVALRQAAEGAVQEPPAQAGQVQNQNDDLMGLIIQRGWLFLRLYMFTYVLSEPNTWRRYLLLSLALLVCLLPRENPLNRLLGAARRHVDNLIGPPQPDPRPQPRAAAAAQANAQPGHQTAAGPSTQPRPVPVRGAVSTTPEEAAARILRERATAQQRQRNANPNVLRDIFYRIEQAIALFLASLIPGVGERHVAAREEQRRLEAQAEVERDSRISPDGGTGGGGGGGGSDGSIDSIEGGAEGGSGPSAGNATINTQQTTNKAAATTPSEHPTGVTGGDTLGTQTEGSSSGVNLASPAGGSAVGEDDQLRSRQVGTAASEP